jgi:hypothetical protein
VWIFTKQGFLSIKQHNDDPKKLLIRARVNGDLEKIFPGCKVTKNAGTDYKYRTTVDRSAAAAVIANAVLGINYTEGFKTSVDDHHRRAPFYLCIWEMLVDMQETLSRKPSPIGRRKIETAPQQQLRRSPLERDLVKRLYERLQVCCTDFMDLNEIAGISFDNARAALLNSIGQFFAKGVAETTHLGPEEFGEVMADTLRQVRSSKSQHQTH